jgi:hypothetical protein
MKNSKNYKFFGRCHQCKKSFGKHSEAHKFCSDGCRKKGLRLASISKKVMKVVTCVCGAEFHTSVNKVYCSAKCRSNNRRETRSLDVDISTGSIGAIGELLASSALLAEGYEVFRSVSPSCSCDLMAQRDGRCFRIEVKCGIYKKNGGITYDNRVAKIRAENLLVVTCKDKIVHFPSEMIPFEGTRAASDAPLDRAYGRRA